MFQIGLSKGTLDIEHILSLEIYVRIIRRDFFAGFVRAGAGKRSEILFPTTVEGLGGWGVFSLLVGNCLALLAFPEGADR